MFARIKTGITEQMQEREREKKWSRKYRIEVFFADMDIGDDKIHDSTWDTETQTMSTGELVVDLFNKEEFVKNHQKVKYYTGLPKGSY